MGRHTWAMMGGLLAFTVLIVVLAAAAPALAADELETRTLSTYEVLADGRVHVTIAAQVTNRDPTTQRRSSGRVLFYSATAFAVQEAATNIVARAGQTLLVTESAGAARDSGDPFRLVAVRFDRDLYFNESIDLTLEYDLTAVRGSQVLVNHQYAFVPAIGQGSRSLVRITAPQDRQVTIGSANCGRIAENPITFMCGASAVAADYRVGGPCFFTAVAPKWDCAFTGSDFTVIPFEAVGADRPLATRTSRVALGRGTVAITISSFSGDEAWAARIEEIIRRGMPLLEDANGFPYSGPTAIEIMESGYQDTHGYEGLTSSGGRIRLTPVVDDQTVLHEVSHLWSGIFASRWLAEGMADFTANAAARQMGLRPEAVKLPLSNAPTLEEWGSLRSQVAVSRSERDVEESGYSRSLRFMEILAERAGARTLAGINANLAQRHARADARLYLDLLEEMSDASYESLFAEWVLPAADVQALPARATARSEAATLRARTERAGLQQPPDITDALREWRFADARDLTATASAALDQHERTAASAAAGGYATGTGFAAAWARGARAAADAAGAEVTALAAVQSAEARLEHGRTPLMRVGLAGSDVGADQVAARASLGHGDFDDATARAAAIERRLDGATRQGAVRLGLAGALLALTSALVLVRASRARAAR